MNQLRTGLIFRFAFQTLFLLAWTTSSGAKTLYNVIDMNLTQTQFVEYDSMKINSFGEVTGTYQNANLRQRVFFYNGTLTSDVDPATAYADRRMWAAGISDKGKIIGSAQWLGDDGYGVSESFAWMDGKKIRYSNSPGPDNSEWATAMSHNGHELRGRTILCDGRYTGEAIISYKGASWTIPDPSSPCPVGTGSLGSINNNGWVVVNHDNGNRRIMFYDGATTIDLRALLGLDEYSNVMHINDKGVMVGSNGRDNSHGFIFDVVSGYYENTGENKLNSINNRGVGVGRNITGPVVYAKKSGISVFTDINTLLMPGMEKWKILWLHDINDSGQIAAAARFDNGPYIMRPVLLIPVNSELK